MFRHYATRLKEVSLARYMVAHALLVSGETGRSRGKTGENAVKTISFSLFARAVRGLFPPELNQKEYAIQLLDSIVDYDEEPDENPVHQYSPDTLGDYLAGAPFRKFARKIRYHLDENRFATVVAEAPPNAQEEARKELAPHLPSTQTHEFPEACARLFAEVIANEAERRMPSEHFELASPELPLEMHYDEQNDIDHLKLEGKMRCLLCGKKMDRFTKQEIVPSVSNYKERRKIAELLKDSLPADKVPDLNNGYDTHSASNMCLMHIECAASYRANFSPSTCADLYVKKLSLMENNALQEQLDSLEIDAELYELLDSLDSLVDPNAVAELQYKPSRVANKIETENFTLGMQVTDQITRYYGFLKDELSQRDGLNGFDFTELVLSMRRCFNLMAQAGKKQTEIYSAMAIWVMDATSSTSLPACEILVSFFIQNCEVFNEIAE